MARTNSDTKPSDSKSESTTSLPTAKSTAATISSNAAQGRGGRSVWWVGSLPTREPIRKPTAAPYAPVISTASSAQAPGPTEVGTREVP
jgi:hypothetical protein